MNDNHTDSPRRFRLSIGMCDAMFALMFAGAVFLLGKNGFDTPSLGDVQATIDAADPWLSLAILVLAIPIMALVFAFSANVDRRCAEDYVFQLVANASLVAATGAIFVYVLWDLASGLLAGLRPPYGDDMIGVLIMSWATGWFAFRRRGLTA